MVAKQQVASPSSQTNNLTETPVKISVSRVLDEQPTSPEIVAFGSLSRLAVFQDQCVPPLCQQ